MALVCSQCAKAISDCRCDVRTPDQKRIAELEAELSEATDALVDEHNTLSDRIAELEAALELAAPYTIHMTTSQAVAKAVYAALGRPVGTWKNGEGA